jgi:hypothetical protein
MSRYRVKIDIERADNGFFLEARIHGQTYKEIHPDLDSLYSRLELLKQNLTNLENEDKPKADT